MPLQSTDFVMRKECRTCLIYHIDKLLGVHPIEAKDHVVFTRSREDCLNQRMKFMRSKRAIDQALTDWSVEVDKGRIGKNQRCV